MEIVTMMVKKFNALDSYSLVRIRVPIIYSPHTHRYALKCTVQEARLRRS